MTTCPNCGKEIASDDKFCSNCGTPLTGQPSDPTEPTEIIEVEEALDVSQDPATGATEVTETVSESVEPAEGSSTGSSAGWTPPPPMTPTFSSTPQGRSAAPMPPAVDFKPTSRPSVEEEWRMSSLGPPPKRKRSIWLYLLIGILALCLLSCVGFIGFSMTETGQNWIENLATEAAQQATEAAD